MSLQEQTMLYILENSNILEKYTGNVNKKFYEPLKNGFDDLNLAYISSTIINANNRGAPVFSHGQRVNAKISILNLYSKYSKKSAENE